MEEIKYPSIEQVKEMQVQHTSVTAIEWNASSHGMMACSGVFYSRRIEPNGDGVTLTYTCKREAQDITEEVYRCDKSDWERLTAIIDRENLYAWENLRIDPEKDNRPIIYDYSSSSNITLITGSGRYCINCDTAKFCGGGEVIDGIIGIFKECGDRQENLISRNVTELPKPDWMKRGFMSMGTPKQPEPEPQPEQVQGEWTYTGGAWTCPECNGEGNEGKFCASCGSWRPDLDPNRNKAPQPQPEQVQGEWTYTGGAWTCPECNGEGNEGKFCASCGSWRPDLDPNRNKAPQTQPAFPMMNGMMEAMGLLGDDKPDEQLAALLEKQVAHGRLLSFEYSSWSNGMSMNSHSESSTRLVLSESGEATVVQRVQQGNFDAAVTEYMADERAVADLEKYIRENNLTNLTELKYDRSKDPFANVTDTSGGAHYSIVFDERSVGGSCFAAFSLDTDAISQHGGSEITAQLRTFCDRLCSEGVITSSRREPPAQRGMLGFAGMLGAVSEGGSVGGNKWVCGECGFENSGGKFCNNCGAPKK